MHDQVLRLRLIVCDMFGCLRTSFRSCVHVRCELRGCAGDDCHLVIACGDAVQGEGIPYSYGAESRVGGHSLKMTTARSVRFFVNLGLGLVFMVC